MSLKIIFKHILFLPETLSDSYFSLDACYTPSPGEGPCNAEEEMKIEREPERNVIAFFKA
jgi:hypothetical protein